MITVMSPDGTPIQVASNALQLAGAQNAVGKVKTAILVELSSLSRIVNKS